MSTQQVRVPTGKLFFFALICTFLILSPMSVAGDRSRGGDDLVKWARVIILGMIGLTGLQWFRFARQRVTGRLLLFASIFTIAAVWSTSPLWGLAFKGMFLASAVCGVALSGCLATESDIRAFVRSTTIAATVGIGLVAYQAVVQDGPVLVKGRLWIGQLNPNLLAQSATVFSLLCGLHILVRDTMRWRIHAALCVVAALGVTILSGSRGAALMLLSGAIVVLPVLGRKRRQVVLLGLFSIVGLGLVGTFWMSEPSNDAYLEENSAEEIGLRITRELTKDTRGRIWQIRINRTLRDSPAIGMGWIHRNNRGANVQSAYIQVFAEAGFIGLVFLLMFLLAVIPLLLNSLRLGRRVTGLPAILCYSLSGTAFALLVHGFFESSLVTGASPNVIVLAFCVSQLDRLQLWSRTRVATKREPAGLRRMPPRPIAATGRNYAG